MPEMNPSSPDSSREQDVPRDLVPSSRSRPLAVPGPSGSPAVAPTGQGITFRLVWDALRYWWKWALPAGIALALVGVAVVYLTFVPMYESVASIHVEQRTPFIAFDVKSDVQSNAYVQTQVELLHHSVVLNPVLNDPDPDKSVREERIRNIRELQRQDDKVRWLSTQLKVRPVGQSELLTVSLSCSDREGAQALVDKVVDRYFKFHQKRQSERDGAVIDALQKEKSDRSGRLPETRRSVSKLAKEVTGKDLDDDNLRKGLAVASPVDELERRVAAAELDAKIAEAKVEAFKELFAEPEVAIPAATLDRAVAENPRVQSAMARISDRKAQLHELGPMLPKGNDDPAYRKLAEEIAREEQVLEQYRSEARKQAEQQIKASVKAKQQEELAVLQSESASRNKVWQLLKAKSAGPSGTPEVRPPETPGLNATQTADLKSAKTAEQKIQDMMTLKLEKEGLARSEEVVSLISDRLERLRVEQRAIPRVSRVQDATLPSAPLETLPYKKMALALLAGLCLPFGLAVFKEQLARRVSDPAHLEQQAHLTVIGEIARLPQQTAGQSGRKDKALERALRLFEESIDSLRTHLFLSPELQGARVLAVTSAVIHEGKTSVAAQLAVSIARATHESVLLVDGDLRSPSVHRVFELALEPGMTNVLSDGLPLSDAIQPTWVEHLHVLPAGKLKGNPHRLLSNGALTSLLEAIPETYRYVVLDTPPVLAAAESLVLAKAADAFLMCAMRDVSRVSQVQKASERLVAAGGRLAGTVLSGVPIAQYARQYGHYAYPSE